MYPSRATTARNSASAVPATPDCSWSDACARPLHDRSPHPNEDHLDAEGQQPQMQARGKRPGAGVVEEGRAMIQRQPLRQPIAEKSSPQAQEILRRHRLTGVGSWTALDFEVTDTINDSDHTDLADARHWLDPLSIQLPLLMRLRRGTRSRLWQLHLLLSAASQSGLLEKGGHSLSAGQRASLPGCI